MAIHSKDVTGAKIRSLRRRLGYSNQQGFAELLGVSQELVSAWERGRIAPPAKTLIRLGNIAPFPENLWFFERAGLDRRTLISTASNFLEKQLSVDPGRDVVLPRMEWSAEQAESAREDPLEIRLPAGVLPHPGASYWLRVQHDVLRPVFRRGDVLVIDASETDFRNFNDGELVATHRRHQEAPLRLEEQMLSLPQAALFVGWLRKRYLGSNTAVVLEAPQLDEFGVEMEAGPHHVIAGAQILARWAGHSTVPPTSETEIYFNKYVRILGRVICWIRSPGKASGKRSSKK